MIPFLVWASVSLVALFVEIFTCRLYAVWVTLGGIVAMILYAVGLEWYFGLIGFIVTTILTFIFLRNIALKKLEGITQKRNDKRRRKYIKKHGEITPEKSAENVEVKEDFKGVEEVKNQAEGK